MIKEYVGSLVIIGSKDGRGCSGLLVDANEKFLKVEFRDGRTLTIAIDCVESIVKSRNQTILGPLVVD